MQTNDIVARLRGHIAITTRVHHAKDGYPELVYIHGPSPICQEAANHIEHLRTVVESWSKYSQRAERDIEALRAERDEARRMLCEAEAVGNYLSVDDPYRRARTEAKRRGWDCFKENIDAT